MTPASGPLPSLKEFPPSGNERPLEFLERALGGLRCFQAFMAAYDKGFFEICREPAPLERITRAAGTRPAITRALCEGLVCMGLLRKDAAGNYEDTDLSRDFFLCDAMYTHQAAVVQMRQYASLFLQLPAHLVDGPVVYPRGMQFREVIIPAMAEYARCGLVQRVAGIVERQPEFASAGRLLDLGGGHGLYAIALSQRNPDLRAVVFDLPEVIPATREFIRKYGAEGQVTTQPGDFFRDCLGNGYDIVFSSSNPSGKMPGLIPRISGALKPGGLYINKQVIDEPDWDPFADLEWNLWSFEGMQKQDQRFRFEGSVSFDEYNHILGKSGFIVRKTIPVDGSSAMTIAQRTLD